MYTPYEKGNKLSMAFIVLCKIMQIKASLKLSSGKNYYLVF